MKDFLKELAAYLEDQGVGIWTGPNRNIIVGIEPATPDNLIALLGLVGSTLGVARDVPSLQFPRFQVIVRNTNYDDGAIVMQAVRDAIHGINGVILPHWRILRCHVEQEGQSIGSDDTNRSEFSANYTAEINREDAA